MSLQLAERVGTLVNADASRLVELFKDLHRHPELGFTEVRTARIVAQALTDLRFTVTTGIGGTGVVGILHNGLGPTVMYRADMDALPVEEATGLDYASTARVRRSDGTETPVAHVCG
ncbi:MAG: amidohydrolase, partial [Mycobacterium sp.]